MNEDVCLLFKKSVIFQQPQQKLEGNFAYISEN